MQAPTFCERAGVDSVEADLIDQLRHRSLRILVIALDRDCGWAGSSSPEPLVAEAKATKRLLDDFSPTLEQFAFTRMLARGDYQRQIRRARAVYRGRRDRMTQALAKRLPELAVSGVAAGLHVLLELPVQSDDREIEAASRGAGIALEAAHPLHAHRSRATWAAPGLRAAA